MWELAGEADCERLREQINNWFRAIYHIRRFFDLCECICVQEDLQTMLVYLQIVSSHNNEQASEEGSKFNSFIE